MAFSTLNKVKMVEEFEGLSDICNFLCNFSKAYSCSKLSIHLFTILVSPTNLGHIPRMVSDKENY